MKPLYIFDLDGTLALIGHRKHHVEGRKKNWKAFFAACVEDEVNQPVLSVFHALREGGAEIWIWSGRSIEVFAQTREWFQTHGIGLLHHGEWSPATHPLSVPIRMRAARDYTPDEQLKRSWLTALQAEDRARLVCVFDDRGKVVAMWRQEGIPCFQVAPGEF